MSDERKQCACGAVFYVPEREKCIECTLIERDRLLAAMGPSERGRGNGDVVLNTEMQGRGGIRRTRSYGERLADGFRMLAGMPMLP